MKKALHQSNRPRARVHLKLVKTLEATREQRSESLLNLLQVVENLKKMHTDREILDAYELTSTVLKSTRSALGLDVDHARSTMEKWRQCMEEEEELAKIIAEPTSVSMEEEQILERELSELMAFATADKQDEEEAFNLKTLAESLPIPPNAKIGVSKNAIPKAEML